MKYVVNILFDEKNRRIESNSLREIKSLLYGTDSLSRVHCTKEPYKFFDVISRPNGTFEILQKNELSKKFSKLGTNYDRKEKE